MIKVKECVGIDKFTNKQGKQGVIIYYVEPFDSGKENALGMSTGNLFTYMDVNLKIHDKFKAYFDSVTFNGESRPVLSEIVVVNK